MKRRWVVLTNSCLYYFKKKDDAKPAGIIPLENLAVSPAKIESSGSGSSMASRPFSHAQHLCIPAKKRRRARLRADPGGRIHRNQRLQDQRKGGSSPGFVVACVPCCAHKAQTTSRASSSRRRARLRCTSGYAA